MAWAAVDPDGMLAIGCARSENHLAQQIPGCNYGKNDGIWRVPLRWPAYVAMKTVWASQPLAEHQRLLDWARSAWADVQIAYALRSRLDAGERTGAEIDAIEQGSAVRLTVPQRGGVDWLVTQRRVICADPQRNGKTPQWIRALQVLRSRGVAGPALVICPDSAPWSWRDKLARWAPELSVRVVTGTALKRRQALEEQPLADVYVIVWQNVRLHTRLAAYPSVRFTRCPAHGGMDEKIGPGRCEVHPKELNAIPFAVVIADEAHRMQDARSKQTRAVWHLAQDAPYFWPGSGTITGDTIEGLWPIAHAFDPAAFPSRSRYLDLFAIKNMSWHGGTEILDLRPDTAAAFHAIMQPLMRRIPVEIARPFEPPVCEPEFRYPEMSPAQRTAYRQVRKEALADIGGAVMVTKNAAVKFGRLCQLAASSVEITDAEDGQGFTKQAVELVLPSNKVNDLADFLADYTGQVVVAANSPRLIALCERKLSELKIAHCKIVGGMSSHAKYQAMQWFQDGQCRVIFINEAGAENIDLYASHLVFFLQPDPVFRSRDQKIARLRGPGQQHPVQVVYSISRGTVEERLFALGEEKEERAGSVTRDPDLLRWIIGGDDHDGTKAQHQASAGQESLF